MTTVLFIVIFCLALALKLLMDRVETPDKKSSPDKKEKEEEDNFDDMAKKPFGDFTV